MWPMTTSSSVAGRSPARPSGGMGSADRTLTSVNGSPVGDGNEPTTRSAAIAGSTGPLQHAMVGERLRDRQVEQSVALAEDDQAVAGLLDVRDDVGRQERRVALGTDGLDEDVEELPTGERI